MSRRGEGEGEHTDGGGDRDRDVTDPFRASRLFGWGPLSDTAPCLSTGLFASGYWLVLPPLPPLPTGHCTTFLLSYP